METSRFTEKRHRARPCRGLLCKRRSRRLESDGARGWWRDRRCACSRVRATSGRPIPPQQARQLLRQTNHHLLSPRQLRRASSSAKPCSGEDGASNKRNRQAQAASRLVAGAPDGAVQRGQRHMELVSAGEQGPYRHNSRVEISAIAAVVGAREDHEFGGEFTGELRRRVPRRRPGAILASARDEARVRTST